MSNLYYAIVVATPDNELHVFRKPTGLPFPSPIGTGLWVGFANGIFAKTAGYSHHEEGDFYIFLSPMYEEDVREIPEVLPSNKFFNFTDEEFKREQEALFEDGWDLGNSYFPNYPNPFH